MLATTQGIYKGTPCLSKGYPCKFLAPRTHKKSAFVLVVSQFIEDGIRNEIKIQAVLPVFLFHLFLLSIYCRCIFFYRNCVLFIKQRTK